MDYPVMVQRCSVCHKTDCECLHAHTVNLPHYKMIGTHMYICMYVSTYVSMYVCMYACMYVRMYA